jgi:uncharacterized membrane protein
LASTSIRGEDGLVPEPIRTSLPMTQLAVQAFAHVREHATPREAARTATSIATHFVAGFGLAYALTGQASVAGAVALLEPIVAHALLRVHDALWARA